jgi:predicted RecA/RadA family phage recombinase
MAVTANQMVTKSNTTRSKVPVAGSKRIYRGTLVFAASGLATDVIADGANKFMGVAVDEADNSAGAASAISVEVEREGRFLLTGASLTQAMVGTRCYATDNYTITNVATETTYIGVFDEFVSATEAWIRLDVASTHPTVPS